MHEPGSARRIIDNPVEATTQDNDSMETT